MPFVSSLRDTAGSAANMIDLPDAGLAARWDNPPADAGAEVLRNSARKVAVSSPAARDRSVSSVTPPPVQVASSASAGDSALDRRHFFQESAEASVAGVGDARPGLLASSGPAGKTPDFRGMTLRGVLEESAALGLSVDVEGSGLARAQDPPPGAPLAPRAYIRVRFGR